MPSLLQLTETLIKKEQAIVKMINLIFLPSYVDVHMDRSAYATLFKEAKVNSRLYMLIEDEERELVNPLYWFQLAEVQCIERNTGEELIYKLPYYYHIIPVTKGYLPADTIPEDTTIEKVDTAASLIVETIHSAMLSPCMDESKFIHYYLHPNLHLLTQIKRYIIKAVEMCKECIAYEKETSIRDIIVNSVKWYENELNNYSYHNIPHKLLLVVIDEYVNFFIMEMRSNIVNNIESIVNKYEILSVKIPDYNNVLQTSNTIGI